MNKGVIIMMCGLPGSGKTTRAKELERERNAIRLCPDEWIIALKDDELSVEETDKMLRSKMEKVLLGHAIKLAQLGLNVILENGFWSVKDRNFYKNEIKKEGIKVELHFFDVPLELLWERVNKRNKDEYPFKIESYTLEKWHTDFEKPTEDEGKEYDMFIKYFPR